MPVNEVLDRMAEHKEKQEQAEQEEQEPTAEPTPEQPTSQELMTFTLKLTGTHTQLMEVRRVIDDLGVYFEVI